MTTRIAILFFDGITALDAIGPSEVLSRIPGATLEFVAPRAGKVQTSTPGLELVAGRSITDVTATDLLLVPGGPGTRKLVHDAALVDWIRRIHDTTQLTTSVCTGALLLGAAGILRGLEATTHWIELQRLAEFGAHPVSKRIVFQGKVATAAGVSAGIDLALVLAARLAGDDVAKAIQLAIEYDPEPPFDAGSVEKAGPALVERVRAATIARLAKG